MGIHVKGTEFQVDSAGGSTYAGDYELVDFSPPMMERGHAEDTESDDLWRTFVKGFVDGGEAGFTLRYKSGDYNTLSNIFAADNLTIPTWKITMSPDGSTNAATITFAGILKSLGMPEKSIEGENVWDVDVTIKVSGAVTFTPAS